MTALREELKIDPQKCSGCYRCAIACAMKHHNKIDPGLSSVKITRFKEQEINVPHICMACENAPCIKVCPMNARKRSSNNTVVTDTEVCIGCKACVYICPLGGPAQNPYTGQTMTCDMCEGDESGPWCVSACTKEGALTLQKTHEIPVETARKYAGRMRRLYA